MAHPLESIKAQIRKLDRPQKAELLKALIAELEPDRNEDLAEAWLEEARRRHAELAAGVVGPVSASTVFRRARERLAR